MPPSLIVALCTGPVTMPANRAVEAALRGGVQGVDHRARHCADRAGRTAATRVGDRRRSAVSPGCVGVRARRRSRRSGSDKARRRPRAGVSGSAKAASGAIAARRCASRTQSSGPMPAGSPGTSASRAAVMSAAGAGGVAGALRGRLRRARRPVRRSAAPAERAGDSTKASPRIWRRKRLYSSSGLRRPMVSALGAAVAGARVGLARAFELHDVAAGLGLERLRTSRRRCSAGDLRCRIRGRTRRREPAQIAALRAVALSSEFSLASAAKSAPPTRRARRVSPSPWPAASSTVSLDADQDVARLVLGDGRAPACAASRASTSLSSWKPLGPRIGADDLARLHVAHERGERVRHLVQRCASPGRRLPARWGCRSSGPRRRRSPSRPCRSAP